MIVPGVDERPSQVLMNMDTGFMEGRERLKVYHQALMAGLVSGAGKCSTNLAKVKGNYRS